MFPPDGPDMRNMESSFVKYMWQNNMLISFRRKAARIMVAEGERSGPCVLRFLFPRLRKAKISPTLLTLYRAKGSLIFTGATAALRESHRLLRLRKGKLEFDFWRKHGQRIWTKGFACRTCNNRWRSQRRKIAQCVRKREEIS